MMMWRSYACIVPSIGPGSINPQSHPPHGCLAGASDAAAMVTGSILSELTSPAGRAFSLPASDSGTPRLFEEATASADRLLLLLLPLVLLLYALAQRKAPAPRATQMLALVSALCCEVEWR